MPKSTLQKITLTSDGIGGTLTIDGNDVSSAVRECTIRAGAGELVTVEITLRVPTSAVVSGRVSVHLPDEVRDALIALGWSAPDAGGA